MNRLLVPLSLAGLAAVPVTGQVRMQQVDPRLLSDRAVIVVPRRPQQTTQLNGVPDSALFISRWPALLVSRMPSGPANTIQTPGATIYVSKMWFNRPQARRGNICDLVDADARAHRDMLDLSEPRRHGFRLAAYSITPLPAPKNHVATYTGGPNRRGTRFYDAKGAGTDDMAQAVKIPLHSTNYQYWVYPRMPVQCFTGYRVNISLKGPADTDPWTGRKIVRRPVN